MAIVFVDLELDDEDKVDMAIPCSPATDKKMMPEYPWGTRISLTEKELKKLGIAFESLPMGGLIHGHFMARVTSLSEDQRQSGDKSQRAELQIEQMAVESEDAENEKAKGPKRPTAKVLYKTG